MKKYCLFVILILVFSINVIAQPSKHERQNRKNKIQAEKVKYLSNKLQLSKKKAVKFRQLYNQHFEKLSHLHKKEKELRKKLHHLDTLKEHEIQEISDKIVRIKTQKTLLKEEYYHKFKKILSAKEQVLLHQGEREFRRLLLKKIKNRPPLHPSK